MGRRRHTLGECGPPRRAYNLNSLKPVSETNVSRIGYVPLRIARPVATISDISYAM